MSVLACLHMRGRVRVIVFVNVSFKSLISATSIGGSPNAQR